MRRVYSSLFIVLVFAFCGTSGARGQSMYFQDRESGFAFGGGYLKSDQSDGWVWQAGYSHLGEYDFGIVVDSPIQPHPVDVMSITPYFGIHIFKEKDRTPLSFRFSMSYQYYVIMGEAMGLREDVQHGSAVTIAGRVYKSIQYSGPHRVIPYIGFGFISRSLDGPHRRQDNNDTAIELGLDVVFRLTSGIGIAPGVNLTFDDEDYTMGVSANICDWNP